jgi:hypothetical protein
MLAGLGLAISLVLGEYIDVTGAKDIANWIQSVAIAIALIVPMCYSYYYVRGKSSAWFVLWIIAIILMVVFYIWGVFARIF